MSRLLIQLIVLAVGLTVYVSPVLAGTEEGWVIRSFDARYDVNRGRYG